MEFLLQPGVYRTGDASTLLKLLDNMVISQVLACLKMQKLQYEWKKNIFRK